MTWTLLLSAMFGFMSNHNECGYKQMRKTGDNFMILTGSGQSLIVNLIDFMVLLFCFGFCNTRNQIKVGIALSSIYGAASI